MKAVVLKLLMALAMLAMPFGMAPAAAAPMHNGSASPTMQHCPDQGSQHQPKAAYAECTMACSAALPAFSQALSDPLPAISGPLSVAPAVQLHGLHPETATPPPRIS